MPTSPVTTFTAHRAIDTSSPSLPRAHIFLTAHWKSIKSKLFMENILCAELLSVQCLGGGGGGSEGGGLPSKMQTQITIYVKQCVYMYWGWCICLMWLFWGLLQWTRKCCDKNTQIRKYLEFEGDFAVFFTFFKRPDVCGGVFFSGKFVLQ